jgi:hypothetical protein
MRYAIVLVTVLLATGVAGAQEPSRKEDPSKVISPSAPHQIHASMIQLMRGLFLPQSNVIFTAQSEDPATIPPDEPAATSPNPLKLPRPEYGGWMAVENSALVLAEAANLLTLPRRCANGRPAPVNNADWIKWVQGLRDVSMAAFNAARSRDQDKVVEVSETLTMACGNCHQKYRDTLKEPLDRCI